MEEYKGYITQCGVKIKLLDGHPWAWEIDGDLPMDSPLKSRAASSMDWYNGNEVIYASCSTSCHYQPVYKIKIYNLEEGDDFICYCELQHEAEYNGAYREFVGEDHIKYRSWHFQRYLETDTQHCACVDEGKNGKPSYHYSPDNCNVFCPHGCEAETCFITKKKRDLAVVNILADVVYKSGVGLLEHDVIEKGVRLYHGIIKEIADRKIKEMLQDAKETAKSEYAQTYDKNWYWNRLYGKRFHNTTPIRIYTARGNGKDLMQDLADANEGYEVIHASDTVKAAAQAKRDRKAKRDGSKARKSEKRNVERLKQMAKSDHQGLRLHAEAELKKRGISIEDVVNYEQLSLF